jgi:hypothetical protein
VGINKDSKELTKSKSISKKEPPKPKKLSPLEEYELAKKNGVDSAELEKMYEQIR